MQILERSSSKSAPYFHALENSGLWLHHSPGWRVRQYLSIFDVVDYIYPCFDIIFNENMAQTFDKNTAQNFDQKHGSKNSIKTWLKISMTDVVEKLKFRSMMSSKTSYFDPCCPNFKFRPMLTSKFQNLIHVVTENFEFWSFLSLKTQISIHVVFSPQFRA